MNDLWAFDVPKRSWRALPASDAVKARNPGWGWGWGGRFQTTDDRWRTADGRLRASLRTCPRPCRGFSAGFPPAVCRFRARRGLTTAYVFDQCSQRSSFFLPFAPRASKQGRGGSCLAAAGGSLWVVAGFCGHELNDTHRFDLAGETWHLVETESSEFSPRSFAALAAAGPARTRLVLFGGELAPSAEGHAGAGLFTNEVYTLDTAAVVGGGGVAWTRLVTVAGGDGHGRCGGPSARGWLAATATEGGALVVHGGNDESNVRLADGAVLTGL